MSPFWSAVIQTALSLRGVAGLFQAGRKTIRGALVMPLMSRGLAKGTIKFKFNCFTLLRRRQTPNFAPAKARRRDPAGPSPGGGAPAEGAPAGRRPPPQPPLQARPPGGRAARGAG